MQPNRFFRLLLLLPVLAAGAYFFACQQDATSDPAPPKATSDMAADDRMCPTGYCELTVTVTSACDLLICGDLLNGTGNCTFNCSGSDDESIGFSPQANETVKVCVLSNDGQVCLSVASVISTGITVSFGGSTPISTTLFAGTPLCFNTDNVCGETNAGCN